MKRHAGSALVALVGFVSLFTTSLLLVVWFARLNTNPVDNTRLNTLQHMAVQEALAKIMDGSEIPYTGAGSNRRAAASMAASPGLMQVRFYEKFPNRGYQAGAAAFDQAASCFKNPFRLDYERLGPGDWASANPRWIPLFSWNAFAPRLRYLRVANGQIDSASQNTSFNPALAFNMNTAENPFRRGELYFTGFPAAGGVKYGIGSSGTQAARGQESAFQYALGDMSVDRPLWVQWIPVREKPFEPEGVNNPIVGRYAYWVDVENSKLNLNVLRRLYQETPMNILAGVSDAAASTGAQQYYQQSASNPSLQPKQEIERKVIAGGSSALPTTREGVVSEGDNTALAYYQRLWLGWRPLASNPEHALPYAADASLLDARFLESICPTSGSATNLSIADLARQYAFNRSSSGNLNTWSELLSFIDPAVNSDSLKSGWQRNAMLRALRTSTALYGYEDELDPLGRPKIDLVALQTGGIPATWDGVPDSPWAKTVERLRDPNYHKVYYPNAYPTYGSGGLPSGPRSFRDAHNAFAGNLDPLNSANGDAVMAQMLVNIVEYAQPHNTINTLPATYTNIGIWPAKSMPYVAEVATRARSAAVLLQAQDLTWSRFYAATNNNTQYVKIHQSLVGTDGIARDNWWYMTNALVDMAFGFVNPNPYATNTFSGTLKLIADGADFWSPGVPVSSASLYGRPTGGATQTNFSGTYAARGPWLEKIPIGSEYAGVRASGNVAYFQMGAVPSSILTNNTGVNPTALRLKGWEIWQNGQLFHKVPMPALGTTTAARSWWAMAESIANAGPTNSPNTLAQYQLQNGQWGVSRAVGWFTDRTVQRLMSGSHPFVDTQILGDTLTAAAFQNTVQSAMQTVFTQSKNVALVERVQCIDPTLGHRTGCTSYTVNSSDIGGTRQGHFYGVAGHPWRLYEWRQPTSINWFNNVSQEVPVFSGDTLKNATVSVPNGATWESKAIPWFCPIYTSSAFLQISGVVMKGMEDCLTMHFSRPDMTTHRQVQMTGSYLLNYGRQGSVGVTPLSLNINGESWPVEEEVSGVQYNANLKAGVPGLGSPTEIGSIMCSAPRGEAMVSLGEIGFLHSGLIQRPINFSSRQWLYNPNFGGTSIYNVGSPQNGPPEAMLLDLFTPHPFRDVQGNPFTSSAQWQANASSNTPAQPRIGTVSVNASIAGDHYLSVREGNVKTDEWFDPASQPARAAWVPAALFYNRSTSLSQMESAASNTKNGGKLDPLLQPSIRFRRGFENTLGMMSGDFSDSRALFKGNWGTGVDAGLNWLGWPLGTWSPGRGGVVDSLQTPFVDFNGGKSDGALLSLGIERRNASGAGYMVGLFSADQVSFTTSLSNGKYSSFRDVVDENASIKERKGPMIQATRWMISPIRHFLSEVVYDATGSSDMAVAGNAVDSLAIENMRIALAPGTEVTGSMGESGVFKNGVMAQMANMLSTSANVFTVHVVAQAIDDREGSLALDDGIPRGRGVLDLGDRVAGSRWVRMVIGRFPQAGSSGDIVRYNASDAPSPDYIGAPVYRYRVLEFESKP